jgi:transposase
VDEKMREAIALHRWAVIAEAAGERLSGSERGAAVRQIAARQHAHPDGSVRRYSRGTIDRWLRAHRAGGLDGLRPSPRSDTGKVRAMPELFGEAAALRLELPGRSARQIASILYHRHGVRVAERTVSGQLRRAGLHRAALAAALLRHGPPRPGALRPRHQPAVPGGHPAPRRPRRRGPGDHRRDHRIQEGRLPRRQDPHRLRERPHPEIRPVRLRRPLTAQDH